MTSEGAPSEDPVSLVGLIDALVEPSAPAAIALVPQTWGWAVLAGLALAALAGAGWRWWALRRANAYRRAALAALDRATTASEVAALLRRVALAAYPRSAVAGRTGADWIDALAASAPVDWPAEARRELREAPYRDETAPAGAALRLAAAGWIRLHDPRALPERSP